MALDQSTPVYAPWLEIFGHTRKEFFPNKLFKLPMLDLINSGEQSPGKCFSFQLSSFWLCLFSFLNSRSLKMYFLKHFSLSYDRGTFSPTKGMQKWFHLDGFWLKRFLSFGVFRRWDNSDFCGIEKNWDRSPLLVGNWNNNNDINNDQETCLGQCHFQSVYFS